MLFTPYILILLLDKENIREEMENGGKKKKKREIPCENKEIRVITNRACSITMPMHLTV